MRVQFEIEGKPLAKGRPRFRKVGSFMSTYTPQETLNYENLVKTIYQINHDTYFNSEITSEITVYFDIPKSTSKKNTLLMLNEEIKHTKKPDCDNLAKTILDALNGIAFKDDSQVTDLIIRKRYAEKPKVVVVLEGGNYEQKNQCDV